MLVSLYVKNLALIDETEVYFGPNLNILTGETGAGKSLIIGSVSLALGAKAEKDLIRKGTDYALVELVFQTKKQEVMSKMQELDVIPEPDGTITISRRIQESRSICKINGETVSARVCKELSELLLDIHGQHEHQSLLKTKNHMEILDSFCGEELLPVLVDLKEQYQVYTQLQKKLEESLMDEDSRKKELSLAQFELQEIEDADLQPGEETELEHRYRKMENSRRITEAVSVAYRCLGYESGDGAGNQTGRALRELRSVSAYDEELTSGVEQLTDIDNLLNDLNRFLSEYMQSLEFDEEDFANCEQRLNLLNHLRDKYGNTIEDVIAYGKKQQEKVDMLMNFEVYREQLQNQLNEAKKKLQAACRKASGIRQRYAKTLSAKLQEALVDLNFLEVQFEIQVRPEKVSMGAKGYDEIEFLISTNPGEELKPLANVASGGELSRIMLALKTVLAGRDEIDTLIFDEIDTGISGKTAWKVAKKMGQLSEKRQMICITHLPQIAAMADTHFLIEKNSEDRKTKTELLQLDEEAGIRELARMLGGEELTDAVLENAREMRRQAKAGS